MNDKKEDVYIFSVPFCSCRCEELLERVVGRVRLGERTVIFTPNPQMLLGAHENTELRALLCRSDINLPDGVGVLAAARMLGTPIAERISGIDFAETLLSLAADQGLSLFLLGGRQGVAEDAAERLKYRLPALSVCGIQHGYFQKQGSENEAVIEKINAANPDILFICMGFPTQEQWIDENIGRLPSVKLAMGLGGSMDVWSGRLCRAPRMMRMCGCEWLWRAIREPRRAKIVFEAPKFFYLVTRQRKSK